MNPLPPIPTDNLYKFLFLTGLTIIFGSTILFITQAQNISDKIDTTSLEITKIKTESTLVDEDLVRLQDNLSKIEKSLRKNKVDSISDPIVNLEIFRQNFYNDKNYKDYLEFLFNHKEDLQPFYNEQKLDDFLLLEVNKKQRESKINIAISKEKMEQTKREINTLSALCIICPLLMGLGILISKNAYKNWLELVQKLTDEKLRLELKKLRSED